MTFPIITLTTDFGYHDPFVGIMKGVMLRINPRATFVDLSHGVAPQDVMAGALCLKASAGYFPRGSIHLAVVDPGVGSRRRAIVIETEDACFVGPDNGVLSLAAQTSPVVRTIELTRSDIHLEPTSATFHGRDIFAPAAARISIGMPPQELGDRVEGFTALACPAVERHGASLTGEIIYIDHFGNLVSNIRNSDLDSASGELAVTIAETNIRGLSSSYRAAGVGNYLALFNSWGLLEISRCNGNAQAGLGVSVGAPVSITAGGTNKIG